MMNITVTSKADHRWKRWMKLGGKTGCHQRSDRSFYFHGYQFPVCARCTGVIIGYLIALIACMFGHFFLRMSIAGCVCMLTDWSLQQAKIKESTNRRRLITGICGGFGIMTIQLHMMKKAVSLLRG